MGTNIVVVTRVHCTSVCVERLLTFLQNIQHLVSGLIFVELDIEAKRGECFDNVGGINTGTRSSGMSFEFLIVEN